jgi:branched-chain amino acid transport system substrate-binding protein
MLSRRSLLHFALRVLAPLTFTSMSMSACSLGNVKQDDCASNAACESAFGIGSKCEAGYCSAPGTCVTGHDCRKQYGGGACVDGACVPTIPLDPTCAVVEPPNLFSKPLTGDGAPLVIGAIFSLSESNDDAISKAIRLGVHEINASGGMLNGQQLGLVVCDNGGPGNKATGDARIPLNEHALDYLAGTLGAPFIVGPLTSSDSLRLIGRLTSKQYPTVIISPSATSPALTGTADRLQPKDPYGLFWRTCPSDLLQGQVLAQDVLATDSMIGTVSVLYNNDAYGQGLATVVQKLYINGATTLFPYDDSTLSDQAKLSALIDQMEATNADAVVIVALHGNIAIKLMTPMVGKKLAMKKFFFTDGAKDQVQLLDPKNPAGVKAMLATARGTAPASPTGPAYTTFANNLALAFPGLTPDQFTFLAQGYDATYVGAMGTVRAQAANKKFDGLDVANGLAGLIKGPMVNLNPLEWPTAKGFLTVDPGNVNVNGISGPLDFDPKTGEAPAPIEIWGVNAAGTGFTHVTTKNP